MDIWNIPCLQAAVSQTGSGNDYLEVDSNPDADLTVSEDDDRSFQAFQEECKQFHEKLKELCKG